MELSLYLAMLETLSDEELVELVGREMKRRVRMGVMLMRDPETGTDLQISCFPDDEHEAMMAISPAAHLRYFAMLTEQGVMRGRREVGEKGDVEGVWRV